MEERTRARKAQQALVAPLAMAVVIAGLVVLQGAAAWGQAVAPRGGLFDQPEQMGQRRMARPPAEAEMPSLERIDELNRHREELAETARQRQLELRELEELKNARQREVRAELGEIHEQMAQVERNLVQIQRQQEEARRRLLARAQNESARLTERLRNLQAQAEQMEQTLAELRDRDGEQGRAVRNSLAETREQMHRLEMEMRGLGEGPPMPPRPRGEEMLLQMRDPEPQDEPPMRRRRRMVPERGEMMQGPDRPVLEMREQLGDIAVQLQANNEKVEQLGGEVGRLSESLAQTQDQVGALSSPPRCPGTVGSAGYGYGWQPNFRPYYLY